MVDVDKKEVVRNHSCEEYLFGGGGMGTGEKERESHAGSKPSAELDVGLNPTSCKIMP